MPPSREDFELRLQQLFAEATARGEAYVDIEAGDLHRDVGDYPGENHRMPVCCVAMQQSVAPVDQILYAPPSGQGASLRIRFMLPRVVGA